jgi:hypothetical protein
VPVAGDFNFALYDATLAGVRLWCSSVETEAPRTLVGYIPARGDAEEYDDAGAGEHKTSVELLFAQMPGEARTGRDRYNELRALVEAGNPEDGHYFTHPLEGTYRVKIGEFRTMLGNGQLRVSATLTRVGARLAVSALGAAVAPEAGLEAVTSAADAADAALDTAGLSSPAPAAATAAATRWAEPDVAPRTVFTELGTESQRIQDEIATLDLTNDLDLWPAYKTMVELHYALVGAADAATAEVAAVFQLLVDRPTPLRALIAAIYGSRGAAEKYEQIIKLNDIGNPARVPAGTTLLLPAREPTPRGT